MGETDQNKIEENSKYTKGYPVMAGLGRRVFKKYQTLPEFSCRFLIGLKHLSGSRIGPVSELQVAREVVDELW